MRWLVVAVLAWVVVGCDAFQQPAPSLVAPASGPCAGIPEIPRDQPPDSLTLTADPTLEAEFPDQIDGQPVQDLASGRYVETLCMMGGEASVSAARQGLPAGLDLTKVNVASGQATVNGLSVTITAFRLPGGKGADLMTAIGTLSASTTGESKFSSDLAQATAGGKQVVTWTNAADGSTSYLYSTAETLFVVDTVTPSQADKVFAALP